MMDPEERELREAAQAGMRRAGVHFLKAGYEVLSGIIAFLEEVGGVPEAAGDQGPVRIVLDDDDDDDEDAGAANG